jgi:hypothetical protein
LLRRAGLAFLTAKEMAGAIQRAIPMMG